MKGVEIIDGELFADHRGQLASLNDFRFDEVNRAYFLTHPDTTVVRGWNGHKSEKKFFYCVKGAFALALVEVDDFEHPSAELAAEVYTLESSVSRIVCVEPGMANAMKALTPDSVMAVFSSRTLDEAAGDNYKFPSEMWMDWDNLEALYK